MNAEADPPVIECLPDAAWSRAAKRSQAWKLPPEAEVRNSAEMKHSSRILGEISGKPEERSTGHQHQEVWRFISAKGMPL